MSQQSDISRGREAMTYFHNRAAMYPGYGLTLDQLIDKVSGGGTKSAIFLDGFGLAVRQVNLSESKLKTAMENLADQGQGRLPAIQHSWFRALSDEAQNIDWVSAAPEITLEVAKDVVAGLAEGGESVIGVLKAANVILPILLIGGFVYIAVQKIKKAA